MLYVRFAFASKLRGAAAREGHRGEPRNFQPPAPALWVDALIFRLKGGNVTALMFRLKARGWRETTKLEHAGAPGEPIEIRPALADLTPEERDALRPLLERRVAEAERRSGGAG